MTRLEIQVWSDFVCPFCWLAELGLQQAIDGCGAATPIDICWMPFELRPYPTPTLRPEDGYLQSVWASSVYPAAAGLGVAIRLPTVSPQPHSARAWYGYQYARAQGRGGAYHDAVMRAFFQQDRDIGQADVLAACAASAGLEAADFVAALDQPRWRQAHAEALEIAAAEGITAVPTMQIGRRRVRGLQTTTALQSLLVQALEAARAAP